MTLDADDPVATIARLFTEHGQRRYDDTRSESVTNLAHALQCADLAEAAGAPPTLVAAAFVHDLGHLMHEPGDVDSDAVDDTHEARAAPLLRAAFGPAVAEPVRLHVAAKRWLVATDPRYRACLSAASIHSLALQGGPLSASEVSDFESSPFSADAVALRRWDDRAKEAGRAVPPIGRYLSLLQRVRIALPTT